MRRFSFFTRELVVSSCFELFEFWIIGCLFCSEEISYCSVRISECLGKVVAHVRMDTQVFSDEFCHSSCDTRLTKSCSTKSLSYRIEFR